MSEAAWVAVTPVMADALPVFPAPSKPVPLLPPVAIADAVMLLEPVELTEVDAVASRPDPPKEKGPLPPLPPVAFAEPLTVPAPIAATVVVAEALPPCPPSNAVPSAPLPPIALLAPVTDAFATV